MCSSPQWQQLRKKLPARHSDIKCRLDVKVLAKCIAQQVQLVNVLSCSQCIQATDWNVIWIVTHYFDCGCPWRVNIAFCVLCWFFCFVYAPEFAADIWSRREDSFHFLCGCVLSPSDIMWDQWLLVHCEDDCVPMRDDRGIQTVNAVCACVCVFSWSVDWIVPYSFVEQVRMIHRHNAQCALLNSFISYAERWNRNSKLDETNVTECKGDEVLTNRFECGNASTNSGHDLALLSR